MKSRKSARRYRTAPPTLQCTGARKRFVARQAERVAGAMVRIAAACFSVSSGWISGGWVVSVMAHVCDWLRKTNARCDFLRPTLPFSRLRNVRRISLRVTVRLGLRFAL